MDKKGGSMIPGDGTGWGKRGKQWFTPGTSHNGPTIKIRRLEARVTSLEAARIIDNAHVERLVEVVKDLPLAPPGVQLSDKRRAEIAEALKPFGVTGFRAPHRSPQYRNAA